MSSDGEKNAPIILSFGQRTNKNIQNVHYCTTIGYISVDSYGLVDQLYYGIRNNNAMKLFCPPPVLSKYKRKQYNGVLFIYLFPLSF